jgi:hypothetical protein
VTNPHETGTNARRAAGLVAGVLAGLAVARLLRRRRAARAAAQADADPRADELRRKLAETGEVAGPEMPEVDADAARRRVHDEAHGAIEEMRRSGEAG